MGRRPDPKRKAEILGGLVDFVLDHGLSGLSLRPAAATLGTSDRILLHHFGTKENLILAVVAEIRSRLQQALSDELAKNPTVDPGQFLLAFWRSYAAKKRGDLLLFLFEVWVMALRDRERFAGFLEGLELFHSTLVQGLTGRGIPAGRSERLATILLATFRGLMLDLLTTGDRRRVEAAVAEIGRDLDREIRAAHRQSIGR